MCPRSKDTVDAQWQSAVQIRVKSEKERSMSYHLVGFTQICNFYKKIFVKIWEIKTKQNELERKKTLGAGSSPLSTPTSRAPVTRYIFSLNPGLALVSVLRYEIQLQLIFETLSTSWRPMIGSLWVQLSIWSRFCILAKDALR